MIRLETLPSYHSQQMKCNSIHRRQMTDSLTSNYRLHDSSHPVQPTVTTWASCKEWETREIIEDTRLTLSWLVAAINLKWTNTTLRPMHLDLDFCTMTRLPSFSPLISYCHPICWIGALLWIVWVLSRSPANSSRFRCKPSKARPQLKEKV